MAFPAGKASIAANSIMETCSQNVLNFKLLDKFDFAVSQQVSDSHTNKLAIRIIQVCSSTSAANR